MDELAEIFDYYRERRHMLPESDSGVVEIESVEPNDPIKQRDTLSECLRILNKSGMSREQREAYLLLYLVGCSIKEIALITEAKLETVRTRLYIARYKVKTYLVREKKP